jgi:glutathione synthase/RimK-type ligase-like ATP-grasp enzyme
MGTLQANPLVLLVTDFRGLIPQRIWDCEGYDLEKIKEVLEGAGAEVCIVGAHELDILAICNREMVAALYASSQKPRYKQYLQDIVANLLSCGVLLFPAFEHMLAHQDKAFQAVKLSTTDIRTPRSYVFGNRRQAYEFLQTATFPLVGKSVDGFGSWGVRLINNLRGGRKFVDRHMVHRALHKGRSLPVRVFQRIVRPAPVLGILLFQELIPGLQGDWKILIWGDTACGLYRENRSHDFRASGGGRFQFIDVPVCVLDFAREALDKLDLPWASFDIAYDGTQCCLLEYQGIHFGLTTAEKGLFYYVRDSHGLWQKRTGRIQIETEMAKIVAASLRKRGWLTGTPDVTE